MKSSAPMGGTGSNVVVVVVGGVSEVSDKEYVNVKFEQFICEQASLVRSPELVTSLTNPEPLI